MVATSAATITVAMMRPVVQKVSLGVVVVSGISYLLRSGAGSKTNSQFTRIRNLSLIAFSRFDASFALTGVTAAALSPHQHLSTGSQPDNLPKTSLQDQ
jgi:hypothetical protein